MFLLQPPPREWGRLWFHAHCSTHPSKYPQYPERLWVFMQYLKSFLSGTTVPRVVMSRSTTQLPGEWRCCTPRERLWVVTLAGRELPAQIHAMQSTNLLTSKIQEYINTNTKLQTNNFPHNSLQTQRIFDNTIREGSN